MASSSSTIRKTVDVFCPRCNILVEAIIRAAADVPLTGNIIDDAAAEVSGRTHYQVALCRRCDGPFLIQVNVTTVEGIYETVTDEQVLFPSAGSASFDGVPDKIRRIHDQAQRSFKAGLAEPCAIMCRKAVEAVCAELGASGKTLQAKLGSLRSSGKLDSRLADWADGLRMIGNDAAHDLSTNLDQNDARDALEFVEAILMYVFSLQTRFDAFQARRGRPDAG